MADAADNKNRNIIIAAAALVIVVVIGVGILVWSLGKNTDEKPNQSGYSTVTPGAAEAAQQEGDVDITPSTISMTRGPDGRLVGIATVSALFQTFTVQSVTIQGDARLNIQTIGEGICKAAGTKLSSGSRCQVTVVLDEQKPGTQTSATPTLVISGTTLTPGGSSKPIEKRATITGVDPASVAAAAAAGAVPGAIPDATAIPGATPAPGTAGSPLTSGQVAGGNIDPYGPVAPTNGYSQQPQQNYAQNQGQQQLRPLSPREQFMLARRQAVLGNVVRTPQSQPQVSSGDWDEIGVKKAVSSLPQDMSRVVTMDRIITAVLVRPFDSRQSQQVVAQVDRNVYGGMGRNILIPHGSTIIGTAAGGAERIAIVWQQIIRPDGARFVFQGTGGDAMGQAGVPGAVNNRWLSRIGASLLGTVLKVGTALASNAQETPGSGTTLGGTGNLAGSGNTSSSGVARNNGAIVSDITAQGINEALAPIIAQQKALLPIITVPAGSRLTIVPTTDLVMRPIQRQTIVRPSYPRQMNGGAQISAPPEQEQGNDQGGGSSTIQDYPARRNTQQRAAPSQAFQPPAAAAMGATPPWSSN